MTEENNNDYAKHRADAVERLFYGLGIRKPSKAIAEIVEREIREAIKREREACAKIAESEFANENEGWHPAAVNAGIAIARVIRERGEK